MKKISIILLLLTLTTFAFGKEKIRPLKSLSKNEISRKLKSTLKPYKPLGKKSASVSGVQTEFNVQRFSQTLKPDSVWQITFPASGENGFYLLDIDAQILGSKLYPEMLLTGFDTLEIKNDSNLFEISPNLFANEIDGGFLGSQNDLLSALNYDLEGQVFPEVFFTYVADEQFGEGGYFEFSLLTFEANKIDSLDTEPNDDFQSAQNLQNDFIEGDLFTLGSLKFTQVDSSDDVVESESDFFVFEAVAGVPYEITLNSNTIEGFNSAFDSFVKVYDSNRNLISENDDYFHFLDSRIVFKPITSGQHFIEISSASNSFSDQNLSLDRLSLPYEIRVKRLKELAFTENFAIDSTNTTTTQKLDFSQTNSIEFNFTTNNNGWIFEFETNSQGSGFSLDTRLKLYSLVNGTEQLIAENDDKNFPFAVDSRLTTILPDSGDYKLVVENYLPFGGELSDYLPEELQGLLIYRYVGSDVNEENDFFWSATQIPISDSLEAPNYTYSYNLTGNLLSKDDLDYFVFRLQDSTDFNLYTPFEDTLKSRPIFFTFYNNEVSESENPMETLFKFYDRDFNTLGRNESLFGNSFYSDILTFSDDGNFYLELSHEDGEFGDYDINFRMDAGFEFELPEELELAPFDSLDEFGFPLYTDVSWQLESPIQKSFNKKSDFHYFTLRVDSNLVFSDTSLIDSAIVHRELDLTIKNQPLSATPTNMEIYVEFILEDGTVSLVDTLSEDEESFYFTYTLADIPEIDYIRISHFSGLFNDFKITLQLYSYELIEPLLQVQSNDTTETETLEPIPEKYSLSQNFPNPFNPSTQINYSLKQPETVNLKIFNVLGQEVVSLVNSKAQKEGSYSITWNGTDKNGIQVGSGVYFYRIEAGEFVKTKKMLLLR